jgi:hypothetical protein
MTLNRRDLLISGGAAAAAGGVAAVSPVSAQTPRVPAKWDHEADVVVIGAGATGFTAAIVAREAGSSVIVLEAEKHIGGHAITSGGNVPLGGGTSVQKSTGSKIRRIYCFEISPTGLWSNPTDFLITDTTIGRLSALSPTTAYRLSNG